MFSTSLYSTLVAELAADAGVPFKMILSHFVKKGERGFADPRQTSHD